MNNNNIICYFAGKTYKAILFDVDSKDPSVGMSCPPKAFLSKNVLDSVKTCIKDNGNHLHTFTYMFLVQPVVSRLFSVDLF